MALYYECGNGWVQTTFAKKDFGMDAYLCCPGPSLSDIDPLVLKGPGRMIFAINTAYPRVKPDIWMGLDRVECYDKNILHEPFIKIFRGTYFNEMESNGIPVKNYPNVYWASLKEPEPGKTMLNYRNHNDPFVWHKNTMAAAIHLMIWMGARVIYLAGCDMGGKKDYYDDRQLSTEKRDYNRRLYSEQIEFIRKLSEQAKDYFIHIKSVTPGSPLNDFLEYIPVSEALAESERKTKFTAKQGEYLHAVDAEHIYKRAYDQQEYRMGKDRFDHAVSVIQKWEPGRLLDIGCGRGEILDYAESKGFTVKGTEIVDDLIDGRRIIKSTSKKLNFENNEFDYVTCLDVLEHINPGETDETLCEIDRVSVKAILLSIANYPSRGLKGVELHINRRPYDEWDKIIRNIWTGAKVEWLPKGDNITETWMITKT